MHFCSKLIPMHTTCYFKVYIRKVASDLCTEFRVLPSKFFLSQDIDYILFVNRLLPSLDGPSIKSGLLHPGQRSFTGVTPVLEHKAVVNGLGWYVSTVRYQIGDDLLHLFAFISYLSPEPLLPPDLYLTHYPSHLLQPSQLIRLAPCSVNLTCCYFF